MKTGIKTLQWENMVGLLLLQAIETYFWGVVQSKTSHAVIV